MWRLFGRKKPKEPEVPKHIEAIIKIQSTIDLLHKKQKFIGTKIDREIRLAKDLAKTNRKAALAALKRKRMYDDQVNQMENTIFNLQTQKISIEGSTLNMEVFNVMKEGSEAMKHIHGQISIDDVDDIILDVQDQMDISNEIGRAISQTVSTDVFDEDELEKELMELANEDINLDNENINLNNKIKIEDKKMVYTSQIPTMPSVPTNNNGPKPPAPNNKVLAEELRRLEEDMLLG